MANIKNNAASQETRRKLIDAAGAVFAERGLYAATIKEITDRAGVNAAAVNYHFSDKFELYAATVRHALSLVQVAPPADRLRGPPEDRLRAAVTNMIEDFLDPSRPAWRATLLAHEFAQPTTALEAVLDELIRPQADYVNGVVRELLGPGASEKEVIRAALSIGGQCFFFTYSSKLVQRLHPQLCLAEESRALAAHVVEFSLGALRSMRRSAKPGKPAKPGRSARPGRPGPKPRARSTGW